jgi:hypothetical protein
MLWIVANFYVDPSLSLKVREALVKEGTIRGSSSYSLFSLGWLGYTSGAHWTYNLSGSLYGNGTTNDSVIGFSTVDSIGTCYKPSTDVAFWVSIGTSDSGAINDTGFTYFDGTLYSERGIMVAKYNATTSDSWEAWDTCFTPLSVRFPVGDIDGDTVVDSAWVESATMRVSTATSTELATYTTLPIGVWASALASSYNIDSIIIYEHDRHIFQINYGKAATHTDSTRYIYYMYGTPAIDTTFYDIYHKVLAVGVAERPNVGYVSLVIKKDAVSVAYPEDYTLSVYSSTGRLVSRFNGKGSNTYHLPKIKGVYFIVFRAKGKVLVRPYVR